MCSRDIGRKDELTPQLHDAVFLVDTVSVTLVCIF